MENQEVAQMVVTERAKKKPNLGAQKVALFKPDGSPLSVVLKPVATGSAVGTVGKSSADPEPAPNTIVPVTFTNGNSAAAPTLAFSGGTARPILLGGTAPVATELVVAAGGVVLFWFDGTSLHQLGAVT